MPTVSYELLVPFLAFASVMAVGGSILAARVARRDPVRARLYDGGASTDADASSQAASIDIVERVGKSVSGKKGVSVSLQQQLVQAGYQSLNAPAVFLGAKFLLFLVGIGAGIFAMMAIRLPIHVELLIVACTGALLSFVPNFVVASRRGKRRNDVRVHLADAVDLLEICVSSGMGLDMAWNSVSDEMRRVSSTLADEMALTNLEIHLGADRAAAMRHMAARTGADELSSLVATIVQTERFGTSIADALKVFATSMREQRSQKAEEAAEKMAVKLLFPMVLCIFPAMLIVVAGPSCITIFKTITKT